MFGLSNKNLESKSFKIMGRIYYENNYKKIRRDVSAKFNDKSVVRANKYCDTVLSASVKKCPNDVDRTALVVFHKKLPLGYVNKPDKKEVNQLLAKAKSITITITGGDHRFKDDFYSDLPDSFLTITYTK